MPAQYEGHDWLLVEYKGNNKYAREKVLEPKVSWMSRDYDATASGCIEGASTEKRSISHCEAMCIPQCNLSEGDSIQKSYQG